MKKRYLLCALLALILLGLTGAGLMYFRVLVLNTPSRETYPVRGVDVSSYQGEIEWDILEQEDIQFAFLKATEGSGSVDPKFEQNWQNARETDLAVGAYHFFSYDSSGDTQADNFIETVPKGAGMLPPVIDVEFYGDKEKNLPDKAAVNRELQTLCQRLRAYYGKRPILYATAKSYRLYLSGGYSDCDIWIRDVYLHPSLPDSRAWTFWQYSDRGLLNGYKGVEKYIDLNVFCGSQKEFEQYTKA